MTDSASGVLYLVSTPIGNLGDITLRAAEVLREVDFVICEDSRRSGMLLKHLGIRKPLRVYHDHSPKAKERMIMDELEGGCRAALVTDAGTPLVSDPGFGLVRSAIEAGIRLEALPGPVAFVNALVLSGLPANEFTFAGFLPQKQKARKDSLARLAGETRTLIFYESPYRLLKTLADMREVLDDRKASVSREMTKKFEETVRGTLSEILEHFQKGKVLGEFVIVVAGKQDE